VAARPPITATAIRPATRLTALLMPEAVPDRSSGRLVMIAVDSGATTSAMPRPMSAVAGKTPSQTSCVPTPRASPAKASATIMPPAPIRRPGP
jgi:hypothetical protein